ncbi:MAG: hypothetical protein P4M10_08720 [Verrucomicrobiae bacterium]|nr:hypothetical protein [Verrucomicrobiae bacterium]
MNNWKIIPTIVFATVLIFGAGVFSGGMLVDYAKRGHPAAAAKRPAPVVPVNSVTNPAAASSNNITAASVAAARQNKPPEILSKEFLQRLDSELRLNKEQHEAIQKVIGDGQNEMRKVVQDARLEIREVLAPGQRDQFDDLVKRPFHKPIFATNAPAAASAPAAAVLAPVPTNAP